MPSRPSAKKHVGLIDQILSPLGVISLIILIGIISGGLYLFARPSYTKNITIGKVQPTPTPTPTTLLPDDGTKGTYSVSANQRGGPRINKIVFDPFNAQKNQPLTITIYISNESPVDKVSGIFKMDSLSENVSFKHISRTDKSEVWQFVFPSLPDTVLYNYVLDITANAANGTGFGGAAPRSR